MRGLPAAARGYIGGTALAAALCAAPAIRLGAGAPWSSTLALALLYAGCEQVRRCPLVGGRAPSGTGPAEGPAGFPAGWASPVLLAGVCLLPPPLAAITAVPGALTGPAEARLTGARRLWHAAELAPACWAAAQVFRLTGGHHPWSAPQFPVLLLPAAAAAATFCAVLAALDGGVLIVAERHPVRTAWRGLLTRSLGPHLVHGLAGLMMAVLWRSSYGPPAALLVLLPMCLSCWVFAQYHRERAAHQATIRALVQAVDIKDRYTRGHSERVGRASVMIARELGMAEDRVEVLRFAGILHDVGKLGVPTRLLRKDGPLTPQERRVIELHPEYGHEIVRGIGFLGEARAAILHHHERLDGRGYPYGLRGHHIPEYARVVAVADAFDAMTSTRSYRRARPVPAAVEELRKCAGAQFDPRMVRALAASLDRYGWHPDLVTAADAEPTVVADGGVPRRDGEPVGGVVQRRDGEPDGGVVPREGESARGPERTAVPPGLRPEGAGRDGTR
ncbi:putative nucleotidyltransferase with HDIG domain [Streptomyces sp. 2333.5]|uniref:HD-GYP domain-containing protein n=1 Tax=unclassified Streptomyces TaxID=2593676 RepID=UPI00089742A6|nr:MULTISPECIES: HD-GYP domain-containing protein [unclassified Streptomyces]PJJ04374.1 putative nucleotidyltransferase with HDIG domain [Streptomyces sp. 2333.5]SEE49098.1 HDIG domain-containing protein [Streptomyces sp. 2314.4]SEE75876.1 HDIG domain-containing protein [Streptomyces sp. 2112.2]